MSLKKFHIFFIACSILCVAYFALWCLQYSFYSGRVGYFMSGMVSVLIGLSLIIYGIAAAKKLKDH